MKDAHPEFSLRARKTGGGTATLNSWGANSDYGTLRSVMLGPIENYRWLQTSSVSKKTLRRGVRFDADVARAQHGEMVSAYQSAGVDVHSLTPDPELPYQVYARDSSVIPKAQSKTPIARQKVMVPAKPSKVRCSELLSVTGGDCCLATQLTDKLAM